MCFGGLYESEDAPPGALYTGAPSASTSKPFSAACRPRACLGLGRLGGWKQPPTPKACPRDVSDAEWAFVAPLP
jgi:hypothetical protein